jgi:Polysaccharide pyruvyl transferase.
MKNIAYVGGYWAPNIGNAFFNLGAEYVLRQAFPESNINMIYDQPGYLTFWNRKKGNPPNSLEFIKTINVDNLVILGPCITKSFLALWEDTIKHLVKKGTKYMILSAGMMHYDDDTLNKCKKFFEKYPPSVFITRDVETYDEFKDVIKNSYCGIDLAFFLPDVYKPIETDLKPYIVLNFDKIPEPSIEETYQENNSIFCLEDKKYKFAFSGLEKKIASRTDRFTDAYIYLKSILPYSNKPEKIGKYTIIRTDHRYSPMFRKKVYRYKNSFCADIPHTYLNIYAETELTLSDRVHACAVTLAYGNKAMFFAKTGRSSLLDRVGANDISKRPTQIDMEKLNSEKIKLINYLKEKVRDYE